MLQKWTRLSMSKKNESQTRINSAETSLLESTGSCQLSIWESYRNEYFPLLFVRILNRIAHVKKFSYTQTYSISLQKARKNTNLSLNPIRNPDTHDALLMITYHDFSTHFFCIPKNINFCKIHIWNPYTHWSGKASKNTSKKVFQGAPDLSLL